MKSTTLLIVFFIAIISSLANATANDNDIATIFHTISKSDFSINVLPYDFAALIKLLDYGKKTNKPRAYTERVFRVFTRLIKGAPYINAYTYADALNRLPNLLEDVCMPKKSIDLIKHKSLLDMDMYDRFKESMNSVLYNRFLSDYSSFKADPDMFFNQISCTVTELVEEEVLIQQLRHLIVRFFELSSSKLVWSPDDQGAVWTSVKNIARGLEKLAEYTVIEDIDLLDDLYWTLLYRFGYFLNIFGAQMTPQFYDVVNQDLQKQQLLFLELEEQESWLETKADYLKRVVQNARTKRVAYEHGIVMGNNKV